VKTNLEVLQDWLEHPGTALFFGHLDQEWGAGGARFEGSINKFADSREDDALILRQIQQIAVCRREILKLKEWPAEEVTRLRNLVHGPDASPRRPMAPELVGQGRRGGL